MREKLSEDIWGDLYLEFSEFVNSLGCQETSEASRPKFPIGPNGRISHLVSIYGLSYSERIILTLLIAQEIVPFDFRVLLAGISGTSLEPTSLGLTAYFCQRLVAGLDPNAFTDDSTIVSTGIMQIGTGLTNDSNMRTLNLSNGVLLYIQGVDGIDPTLTPFAHYLEFEGELSDSQELVLQQARKYLKSSIKEGSILIYGSAKEDMQILAIHLLKVSGPVLRLDVASLCSRTLDEIRAAALALGRQTKLLDTQVLIDATGDIPDDQMLANVIQQLLAQTAGGVVIMVAEPLSLSAKRTLFPLEILPPTSMEQRAHWAMHLKVSENNSSLDQISDQFRLSLSHIERLAHEARAALPESAQERDFVGQAWQLAKLANRRAMGQLAQRVETKATWDDLILPDADRTVLQQITAHVRYRSQVYEELGMSKPGRGKAITALFSGPSGTGKTLSAEVLANDLNLDLYRIDMSSTISKYIGETEKNLRKIFDVADQGGCILLFDEADSVFGKRGEVKDANDRYANVQVNYLLQRLETFNGLAILTTNMESSMDIAFMRRLQFVLNFRAPGVAERERLWRKAFPPTVDTSELDFAALAKAEVSGGNIRSIAVNAVLTALSRDQELSQEIVEDALHLEYRKLGRLVL